MNLRTLRYALLIYATFDFFLGYAGFLPLDQLAAAQFTQVSGTVTDPNGLPYANGTISPILVLPGGTSPTLNGLAYTPPSQPVGLSSAGSFVMNLADNTVLQPAGTKWNFQVCSAAGTVQPAGGKGPVCFSLAAPITISGSSQSITANLNAVALALSFASGITNSAGANVIPKSNGTNLVASSWTDNGTVTTTTDTQGIGVPDGTCTNPTFFFTSETNTGFQRGGNGTINVCLTGLSTFSFNKNGTEVDINNTGGNIDLYGNGNTNSVIMRSPLQLGDGSTGGTITTNPNCTAVGTAANPSVAACTSAAAGLVSCATNASTGTCQVNDTSAGTNSEIFVQQRTDTTAGTRLGVTCNTTVDTVQRVITAVSNGASFTFNLGTIATNPECFNFWIVNK
jgi:hypothetical protein